MIRLETEQLVGITVNCPFTDPLWLLLRIPLTSPVTEIVPPEGPLHESSGKEIGQLQVNPAEVEVQPLDVSG